MAEYLHQKKGSSLWYYRRRYPREIAELVGTRVFMKSLETTNKREAERRSRAKSVQFDEFCQAARLPADDSLGAARTPVQDNQCEASAVLAGVPDLMRLAASRVVEEQLRDPVGWRTRVENWQYLYQAMRDGAVHPVMQRPAIEAQAILKGIDAVLNGQNVPDPKVSMRVNNSDGENCSNDEDMTGSWESVCEKALERYHHKVGSSRYKLAKSKLPQLVVSNCTAEEVEESLRTWCESRRNEVVPRTVKTQLDCMASALRLVFPELTVPEIRWLKGVMQARQTDRESMPVQEIQAAIKVFEARPKTTKVRLDYAGGASQFDAFAVRALALLGMRPCELVSARSDALVTKTDVLGNKGTYFRVRDGKNRASERDIPLSDGRREVLDIARMREMLVWQESNQRSSDSARVSLGTRFKKLSGGYTLYQMRHAWKDIAVHAAIDFELRERLLGHRVHGVAAVYGSGIPLQQGLDALLMVRQVITGI